MRKKKVRKKAVAVLFLVGSVIFSANALSKKIPEIFAAEKKEDIELIDLPIDYQELLWDVSSKYPNDERMDHMIQNYKAYPKELLEMLKRNPDTFTYVYEYPLHHEKTKRYELNRDEVGTDMPFLYQWDVRWGYQKYGENWLSLTGCGPTALSMIMSYLKQDASITPDAIARYSEQNGYYLNGQGTSWQLFYDYANAYRVTCEDMTLTRKNVEWALSQKHPILVSMGPGDFTQSGHLIVLSGIDEQGKIIVHDPNSSTRSAKHWDLSLIQAQSLGAWEFY